MKQSENKTKFFFDLEETVISVWSDPVVMNKEVVQKFMSDRGVEEVTIFSFAVWEDKDVEHFDKTMRAWLEREFGFKVVEVLTVDRIYKETLWKHGAILDTMDFISIWGKQRAFLDFCQNTQKANCVLLDDCVDDVVLTNNRTGQTVECVNVQRLGGQPWKDPGMFRSYNYWPDGSGDTK